MMTEEPTTTNTGDIEAPSPTVNAAAAAATNDGRKKWKLISMGAVVLAVVAVAIALGVTLGGNDNSSTSSSSANANTNTSTDAGETTEEYDDSSPTTTTATIHGGDIDTSTIVNLNNADPTSTTKPASQASKATRYLDSVGPIESKVRIIDPSVVNGYSSCNDLKEDISNALKHYVSTIIASEIQYGAE